MTIDKKVANDKKILKGKKGWWQRFLERLSLCRGDGTCHLRLSAIKSYHYYNLLEHFLKTHDFMEHPKRIYNVDEIGMPLDPPTQRVVAKKGQKKLS